MVNGDIMYDENADDEFLDSLDRLGPAYTRFTIKKGIEIYPFYRAALAQLHWVSDVDLNASNEFESLIKTHQAWEFLSIFGIWDVFRPGDGGWSWEAFRALSALVACCLSGACSAESPVPKMGCSGLWEAQAKEDLVPLVVWLADMEPLLGSVVHLMKHAMANAEKRRSKVALH